MNPEQQQPPQPPPYPQQPGFGAPQPGYGPAYPTAGYPGAAPSNVTALITAFLAFLGGAGSLWGAFGSLGTQAMFVGMSADVLPGWYTAVTVIIGIVDLALAAALITGGVFLLKRKKLGPILVAAACGVAIALGIIGMIAANAVISSIAGDYGTGYGGIATLSSIAGLIFPIATMVLALIAPTRRYCTQ